VEATGALRWWVPKLELGNQLVKLELGNQLVKLELGNQLVKLELGNQLSCRVATRPTSLGTS